MIGTVIPLLIKPLTSIIESIFPDKKEQDEAKAKMMALMYDAQAKEMTAKASVVVAEAKGESWLQRNWRPISMMVFLYVIVNNYIFVPYLAAFGVVVPIVPIAPQMWTLLTIGIGGYIGSRGFEKVAQIKASSGAYTDKDLMDAARKVNGYLTQEQVDRINK